MTVKQEIFAVVNVDTDSWQGHDVIESYHKTIESAVQAIPERFHNDEREVDPTRDIVKDFLYYKIKSIALED